MPCDDWLMGVTRTISRLGLGAGVLAAAWSVAIEPYWFQIRREVVERPGQKLFRILHLSDLHLTKKTKSLQAWLQTLDSEDPDLIIVTGDLIADPLAIDPLLDSLDTLLDRPGVFVLGSNDYFAPVLKNPAKYLMPDNGERDHGADMPWQDMVSTLTNRGWIDLSNQETTLDINGAKIQIKGVDDPHINKDDLSKVSNPYGSVDLKLAIAHAPYLRVLDAFADLGADLMLAGHTHGGQLRIPGVGALVANCDIDLKRTKGLHPHISANGNTSVINVSAGLGHSPFTPFRFACRPEAVMITVGIDQ